MVACAYRTENRARSSVPGRIPILLPGAAREFDEASDEPSRIALFDLATV